MTVVVTGASGHIGANLCRALLGQGQRVRALIHTDSRGVAGLPLEQVRGDVLDPESLRRAFVGAEVVYHLAAHIGLLPTQERIMRAVHVDGTRHVVEACRAVGVRRLVHVSSVHALSQQPLSEPLDEERAPAGAEAPAYDRTKAEGEAVVRDAVAQGLDAVIVNPTGVIGPNDFRPSHMGQVLLDLRRGRLPALVAGGFNWVDARDVAEGIIQAAARGRTGQRYLLGGHWRSMRELARASAAITGAAAPRLEVPMGLARLAAPPVELISRVLGRRPLLTRDALRALQGNRQVRYERAARELGYAPRPFEQTLADTYSWFDSMGWSR
ncbi:MAG: NAD-dependent epimerase/dehydratase family protein [Myxococcales bacterium]|nr:NAD-dependent epimerase/dehydratase family protein [Myxococcota bacterium]MDW8282354.1 NAD-dependent epimerase/dehydratase family protein [Myxococcales bacterium]